MDRNELRPVNDQKEAKGAADSKRKVNGRHFEGLEARFAKRCEVELCLDERTSGQALELFRETESIFLSTTGSIGTGPVEETERLWSACVLFAVKRLANGASLQEEEWKQTKGFTLSLILKATKLSLLEFFKELPQFVAKAGPKLKSLYGAEWEKRLMVKEVQADFYYLTVLFNYYKRLCQSLFLSVEEERHDASSGLSSGGLGPSVHMRFGWMLFLVMRIRVLSRFVDLVTYINALLAVVIVMIVHMPPSWRKFSLDDESFFKKRGGDGDIKIIASLCSLYEDASADDVSKMVDKLNILIGDLFRKNSGFRTRSHEEQLAGIDTEGLAYFEGLMDERSIASSLEIVEKEYEEAYQCRGELDERMFINGDENVVGVVSGDTGTSSGTKRKSETISSQNQAPTTSTTGTYPSSPASTTSSPSSKSTSAMTNVRMPPPTPVSVTMSTLKWLRTVISPLSPQPSPELQHFFRSCDHDISNEVTHRAQLLLNEIFSVDETHGSRENRRDSKALLNYTWVEQRGLEARKLYYRVLIAMCKAESQRLGNDNLTALLTNERFHRCMITCAAELVLYTHKTVTMTFPAVLEHAGITAFDLSKVIESYVRHEETLPRELKRHLNSMEQQILESMAWEKGSSLFNSLIVAKKHLAPVISGLGLVADPMPAVGPSGNARHEPEGTGGARVISSPQGGAATLPSSTNGTPPSGNGLGDSRGSLLSPLKERPSAFSAFASPVRSRPQPPLQSVFASPQRPSPLGGGETCAETVINVFFTKVLKLAAVRIKDLCERLHQSNQVLEQVYETMKYILYKETSLFFNRHIDQMILCSIYGVCKVNKFNVTFRTCIEHYGRQPQCKRQVFCNVPLSSSSVTSEGKGRSQETGDIIKFYNEIFVPATKQFLVHLGEHIAAPATVNSRPKEEKNEKDGSGPGSPKRSFPCVPDMSPKKVSPAHNVYVSPLRSAKMETLMSPHSRSLYACVGESTQAYQSPSKDLTAINNRLNRRLGRLDFNGASMVSDSLVAGSLYGCNRTANSTRLTSDSILSGQSQPSWTMVAPLPPSPMKRPRNDR